MRNNIKGYFAILGVIGVLLGRIVLRVSSNYLGYNTSNIIMTVILTVLFCLISAFIIKGYFLIGFTFLCISIPLSISGIGMYLNNLNL